MNRIVFPSDFLWGASTSSYQIEGGIVNDWWEWERMGKLKDPNVRCGKATNHWKMYKKDFKLLEKLGLNAYRMSIEWARIEPERGKYDLKPLRKYRKMIKYLRKKNIEPMVTLHHFTHPAWFHKLTPWHEKESVRVFIKYVELVLEYLGDLVKYWITINEPMVFLLGGYGMAMIPPGFQSLELFWKALENMLIAHREAYYLIHEKVEKPLVSIAHNMIAVEPDTNWKPLDRITKNTGDYFYNYMILEAFKTGFLSFHIPLVLKINKNLGLQNKLDFLGINYYMRAFVSLKFRENPPVKISFEDRGGYGKSDLGWEIYPEGLELVIRRSYDILELPIIITENGIADETGEKRVRYIKLHLKALKNVIKDGIDVNGYFHWSLIDNFEWLEGFWPRFGLFRVDYDNRFKRTITKGGIYYSRIVRCYRGLPWYY